MQPYKPLSIHEDKNDSTFEEIQQSSPNNNDNSLQPLELEEDTNSNDDNYNNWNKQRFEGHLHRFVLAVTLLFKIPTLCLASFGVAHYLFGRLWTATIFSFHNIMTVSVLFVWPTGRLYYVLLSATVVLDGILFGKVYPIVADVLLQEFMTDIDGTPVTDWSTVYHVTNAIRLMGIAIAIAEVTLGCASAVWMLAVRQQRSNLWMFPFRQRSQWETTQQTNSSCATYCRVWKWCCLLLSILFFLACLYSSAVHLLPWPAPSTYSNDPCDPLDDTECAFPFPSFHFLRADPTSATGWRVHVPATVLPRLKGGHSMDMEFLNKLDGFATMGPLLFYLDGLKEAHEANRLQLKGPTALAQSITSASITLLLNVDEQVLVPHSAEIDYLDEAHPAVMVFPAKPLHHATHYALIVRNAVDLHGQLLPQTAGMQQLLSLQQADSERFQRFTTRVWPSFLKAASWMSGSRFREDDRLQLLFDFVTVSEGSQLGTMRTVRDGALAQVNGETWRWEDHVRTIRIDNLVCDDDASSTDPENVVARVIHAELDVPWFLTGFGSGQRAAIMDEAAVALGVARLVGRAKFVVGIPCSVRAAALGLPGGMPLRAIVEYGHGLFDSRNEALDQYLAEIAHRQGYAVVAMDWRGMSRFDLLVVIRLLMAQPNLFESIRDNLIQGYANKYSLLHFVRNRLLQQEWMKFADNEGTSRRLPTFKNAQPLIVFYGNSQGGILGAGYSCMSGATALIDRTVLGVPGTPFALIMTRSLDFAVYDSIMLLNFYHNRHVRLFLSLIQMGWDSTEGSGVLAPPVREQCPDTLLQAGLGDTIVPTIAAEALARGLNASLLPNSPRSIYGIPVKDDSTRDSGGDSSDYYQSSVTLTELMFDSEYAALPRDDVFASADNLIHVCLRRDPDLVHQMEEFINTGAVLNPCESTCHRDGVAC